MIDLEQWRELRKPFTVESYPDKLYQRSASYALSIARQTAKLDPIRERWRSLGGETLDSYAADLDYQDGEPRVRIVYHPDDHWDKDDLAGDCYNPSVNPDINPNILKRQQREYFELIDSEGVYGYIAQFWGGDDWIDTDSIWGFVGFDSFKDSGYDIDLMQSAMDALDKHDTAIARELELERGDLYV